MLVDDESLQRWHQGSAYYSHDKEGGTERRILTIYVFKGYAINGGEHERHEEADAHEAVETCHADDADGSYRAHRGSDGENGQ